MLRQKQEHPIKQGDLFDLIEKADPFLFCNVIDLFETYSSLEQIAGNLLGTFSKMQQNLGVRFIQTNFMQDKLSDL